MALEKLQIRFRASKVGLHQIWQNEASPADWSYE